MKTCPKCNSTYTDDTLQFCLSDGTGLIDAESVVTEEFSTIERPKITVDPGQSATVAFEDAAVTESIEPRKNRAGVFIGGFVAAIILFSVIGMAALGVYYFAFAERTGENANRVSLNNSNSELQQNTGTNINLNSVNSSNTGFSNNNAPLNNGKPDVEFPSAVVNSPADGYLALRSLPNHRKGKLLLKIPHGTVLAINGCQAKRVTIAKKSGRWCRVTHSGKSGWVFDAWLRRK